MIDLRLYATGHHQSYIGTLAGQRALSSLACAHLVASEKCESRLLLPSEAQEFPGGDACRSLEVHAELEAQPIILRAVHTAQRSCFSSEGASFWVAADGRQAALTRCESNPVPWLFGPALILALARLGVYCLHASAYQENGAAIVFVGHSGAGKSSLARTVSARTGAQRLCDDITPIALRAGTLYVLPQFPQLKLSAADQNLPEAVPLKRLVLLNAAQKGMASEQRALQQRELFGALTRHTVATRLYSATDTQIWWQALPQMMAGLSDAYSMRPGFDARAPERAMLAALDALDILCG